MSLTDSNAYAPVLLCQLARFFYFYKPGNGKLVR